MTMRVSLRLLLVLCSGVAAMGNSLSATESSGDLPLKSTRTIRFTTDAGSWLSVDVSPDGRAIVFDLLGDLYLLPISGGAARRITSGPAVDAQPRFSPDGKRIAFISDRSGFYNVWTCDTEGGTLQQVTHSVRIDKYLREFIQPQWMPDGKGILVSHGVDPAFIDGKYDLEAFDLEGHPLAAIKTAQKIPASNSPGVSEEENSLSYTAAATFGDQGRTLYATQYRGQRSSNPHPEGSLFQIVRIDPATGKRTWVTSELGSAVQPLASPDGRYLVYGTKYPSGDGPKTGLKLLDLSTGRTSWLAPQIEPSLQGSLVYRLFGILPNTAFTPDSQAIVVSYGGKLWRIAVPSGATQEIKFTAEVEQHLGPLTRFPLQYNDTDLTVRIVRDVRRSPDGRRLAFVALDRIWSMDLSNGKPRLVTSQGGAIEYSPAWSPDGKYLAYLTWSEHGGHVYRVATRDIRSGVSHPERLTPEADFYDKLVYSPDGKTLALVRGRWQTMLDRADPGERVIQLIRMPATGGAPTHLMAINVRGVDSSYGWPQFSRRDPARVFFFAQGTLWSVKWDGSGQDAVVKTIGALDLLLSPRGDQALVTEPFNAVISVVDLASGREPLTVSLWSDQREKTVHLLTPQGGEFPWWSADGKSFSYSLGHAFFTQDLNHLSLGEAQSTSSASRRLDIVVKVLKDKPRGAILLSGGGIITMHGGEVIAAGDILVRDNRIVAVRSQGVLAVPPGTRRFDLAGKTVLPGYVLTHEHIDGNYNVHAPRVWKYLLALAYGVTTVHDPQAGSSADRFTYADRVETGSLLGPRHVSTGAAVMAQTMKTWEDARDVVRRYSRFYDSHMLKERGSGNRLLRQWVAQAAFEERLTIVGHWQEDLVSQVLDGYSGIEHATFVPWYRDMVQLIAQSGTIYTPTTLIASDGPQPLGYFSQQTDFGKETKLRRFAPRKWLEDTLLLPQLDCSSGLALKQGYAFKLEAEQAAKLVKAGGRVGVATDGLFQGLGAHWEMWALALGGLSPQEVLRSATLTGAEAIGMDRDLGSIEVGKLADLQVLDANPLEDIHNTNSVRWVMKNGRLYEAETLDEVWPRRKPLVSGEDDRPWWWNQLGPAEAGSDHDSR